MRRNVYDRSRWRMSQERFRSPGDEPPPAPETEAAPLRETLVAVFRQIERAQQPWMRALLNEWEALAGARVAAHARAGRLDRQTLVVYVDSAVWLNELMRGERVGLLARLQRRFGAPHIRDLRFQLDPDARTCR